LINKLKVLSQHQGFIKYFKNTSWLMGEKILRMGVGLFVGIWVARYLGPEQFGLLSYAQSFVLLFTAIATLGLDGIVVRELVKYPENRGSLLGTAFGLKLTGAIMILPVLAVAVQLTSNDNYTNLLVFIIASATIFQSFNVIDFYCQATVQSKYVALANAAILAISSVIKIALLLNEAPLIAFAAMVVFDSIVLSCGLIYFYFNQLKLKVVDLNFSQTIAIELLRDSWPLILSGLAVSVYMKIDQVMIKEMIDLEAVGQYAAAVRISEAWYFIPTIIAGSIFPAIINAKKVAEKTYYTRLQYLYDLMVWMTIPVMLAITICGDWIIMALYGDQFEKAGSVLVIHIWASVFVFLGAASGKWLLIENCQLLAFSRTFYGLICNIILNILFIPKHGIEGAAIATLVSYSVAGFFADLFNKKTRKTFFMKLRTLSILRLK
jgi:O-antigen/teichoic acid export membrane protein